MCDNCYAEARDKRYGGAHWGPGAPRQRTKTWGDPVKWNRDCVGLGTSERTFMASLADFFDNEVPTEWRDDAWALVEKCTSLDWIILTKRIGNLPKMLPKNYAPAKFKHVTIVSSVGTQEEIERDMPKLENAKFLFQFERIGISAEPMLQDLSIPKHHIQALDWVICGGESGGVRRPFEIEWAMHLQWQCALYNVPFFFKQDTAFKSGQQGRAPDDLWNAKAFPKFR